MDGNRNMSERFMKDFNGAKVFSLEYDKETLKDMVLEKQEEIERLNNIRNKAIEYLINHSNNCMFELRIEEMEELLEILKEKEND